MPTTSFRRQANGTIDYDFYREAAVIERRRAIKDVASACVALVKRVLRQARRASQPARARQRRLFAKGKGTMARLFALLCGVAACAARRPETSAS